MTRYGLKVAKLFGKKLPAFESQAEAEESLLGFRDGRLRMIQRLAARSTDFEADFSPQSLKAMELWYHELWESDAFKQTGATREEFEECMAIYFGGVVVRQDSRYKWVVKEFAFMAGKWELGVEMEFQAIMLGRFTDHYKTPNNKRRQAIYRRYKEAVR